MADVLYKCDSRAIYFNLPNHAGQGCVGSTRVIGAENEIVEPSSDFGLVCCIHFHTVILRKRLDSSHLPQAMGNKAVETWISRLDLEKDNSEFKSVANTTGNHTVIFHK